MLFGARMNRVWIPNNVHAQKGWRFASGCQFSSAQQANRKNEYTLPIIDLG